MVTRSAKICNTMNGLALYPIPCSAFVHVKVPKLLNCVIISTTRWAVNGYVSLLFLTSYSSFLKLISLIGT